MGFLWKSFPAHNWKNVATTGFFLVLAKSGGVLLVFLSGKRGKSKAVGVRAKGWRLEARAETGGEGQRAGDWRILLEGTFECCWGCHSIILISPSSFLNCHSNILISTNLKAKTWIMAKQTRGRASAGANKHRSEQPSEANTKTVTNKDQGRTGRLRRTPRRGQYALRSSYIHTLGIQRCDRSQG